MRYVAHIRNNETGETRVYRTELEWDHGTVFWWTYGNFGCDCNRHLSFERAAGIEPDLNAEHSCGHTKYTVTKVVLDDGTEIPIDDAK